MGGPFASVVLQRALTPEECDEIDRWLRRISSSVAREGMFWELVGVSQPHPRSPPEVQTGSGMYVCVVPFGKDAVSAHELYDMLEESDIAAYEAALGYKPEQA